MSLPSQSLYRKWRPQTFDALKGQDVIRDTLIYALNNGQMSQSYLFCGTRGTGKTTTARLIAKLINCTEESGTKPCNTCVSCTTITDGANLDITELDAASNRGIDEIRQLRETVRFAPTQAKYKVFIIDEVHMLTREAFNALLKTLEEPPSHAVFILATTEAHKIPATIISRCQRYDFRPATIDTLTEHLLSVAKDENMKLAPEAARFVARLGDGSFRDSLSLLDQVRSSDYKEYTLEVIERLFGYIPQEHMAKVLELILSGDVRQAHEQIDAVLAQGANLRAFCDQLLSVSQQVLEATALGGPGEVLPSLASVAQSAGLNKLVKWIDLLADALVQAKQCPIPRLPLDLAIAKFSLVLNQASPVQTSSTGRVVAVRQSVPVPQATGSRVQPGMTEKVNVAAPKSAEAEETVPVIEEATPVMETVSVPVAVVIPDVLSRDEWKSVMQALKEESPSLVTSLSHAQMRGTHGDVLRLAVQFKMHAEKINQPKNRLILEGVIQKTLGLPLKIEAEVVKDLAPLSPDEEMVDVTQVFELEEI